MITPGEILERINAYTVATRTEAPRTYLGASALGEPCLRKTWYAFRHCGVSERFDGRMLRLFDRGHREEPVIDELLRAAGFTVEVPTPETAQDFKFVDCEGHLQGNCDGVALPPLSEKDAEYADALGAELGEEEWVLLEKKTYNAKNFADLKRRGVKDNDPKYYKQVIIYEGELGFKWCLFFAVCKDSDEIYLEWIPFDQHVFQECFSKAEAVINAQSPPPKISENPKTWNCRYCSLARVCHEGIAPLKNCRSCKFGHPAKAGTWECGKGHTFGTVCEDYSPVTSP